MAPYPRHEAAIRALLGVDSESALAGHPESGASWEGFARQEIVRLLGVEWESCCYWATHRGAELDLLAFDGGRRLGFEFRRTSAPAMTRSMHSALSDLELDRLVTVFPGRSRFRLHERAEAIGLTLACTEGI